MKEAVFEALYKEIDMILPSALYILAAKKQYTKKGASSLRKSVSFDVEASQAKDPQSLKLHASRVYKLVNMEKSWIRMLLSWQAGGGLPYVCNTHFLGVQCFVQYGNKHHSGTSLHAVSEQEFVSAVEKRHDMVETGHKYLEDTDNLDFA